MGAFTAKAAVKARKSRIWVPLVRWVWVSATRSKVNTPVCCSWMKATATMPTSKKAEPRNV